MSRVGKNPIPIPGGVQCHLREGQIWAKGKLGELSMAVASAVKVTVEEGWVRVQPVSDSKTARALWGTTRNLIQNMIRGVHEGFTKRLEINGVGYRAAVQGKTLVLQLGYSHDVNFPIPQDVTIQCEKNIVAITGTQRQRVGQVASEIRSFREPEPYKGKGVKYESEHIFRKEGKKK